MRPYTMPLYYIALPISPLDEACSTVCNHLMMWSGSAVVRQRTGDNDIDCIAYLKPDICREEEVVSCCPACRYSLRRQRLTTQVVSWA
jgi:hypothetical protein